MKNKKQDKGFLKNLLDDYKVVVSNDHTFEEKLSFKASKIGVFVLTLVYSSILILIKARIFNLRLYLK